MTETTKTLPNATSRSRRSSGDRNRCMASRQRGIACQADACVKPASKTKLAKRPMGAHHDFIIGNEPHGRPMAERLFALPPDAQGASAMVALSVQLQELMDRADRAIAQSVNLRRERASILLSIQRIQLELELALWRERKAGGTSTSLAAGVLWVNATRRPH
jgi:hypothetical protein